MFMRWLTFIALLAASVNSGGRVSGRGSVTFESTCRVKSEPEEELILHCGDGKYEGVVQFWHTPFGDLQSSSSQSNLDAAFIHLDGHLVIPNSSIHHSGLYYCILLHLDGSTLWPYELHVGLSHQNVADEDERGNSCSAHRFRRNAGFPEKNAAVVSDETFAGAVAASVLLTFLVGFSAGALLRSRVLRCLQALRVRMSRKKRQHQPDVPDSSRVTMTTLPPMYNSHAFRTETRQHNAPPSRTTETPVFLTTPSPPAKPKRSFRNRDEEKQKGAAYLEGCDYNQEEEGCEDEENEGGESAKPSFHVQDEGSRSETEEDKSEDLEEAGAASRVSRMGKKGGAGELSRREEEMSGEADGGQQTDEEIAQSPTETDDEKSNKSEDDTAEEEPSTSSSRRRRSRVIRLYQYDDDGQRYGHLPDPAPQAPEPAPRLKHRSLSLTRLNAIMAVASTGLMESGKEQGEEKQGFHMKI
ncbi:uncharacterized protein LOC119785735 isoform X2 [Cyprinodon tularosa]|nr:uncharacterized protein LOC119785735 isoform X2 [Cyprinodon tularosa]